MFPKGVDCILSKLRLIRTSLFTNSRSVSETEPCSIIARVGSHLLIAHCNILIIFTIPENISAFEPFQAQIGRLSFRGFQQQAISHFSEEILASLCVSIRV